MTETGEAGGEDCGGARGACGWAEREEVGGGGFGALQQALQRLPQPERAQVEATLRKIPQHMTAEFNILAQKKMTVLEIRDFLSGEFEPIALADLMEVLRAQEKLGLVKLTEKPEEPKSAPPGKKS